MRHVFHGIECFPAATLRLEQQNRIYIVLRCEWYPEGFCWLACWVPRLDGHLCCNSLERSRVERLVATTTADQALLSLHFPLSERGQKRQSFAGLRLRRAMPPWRLHGY